MIIVGAGLAGLIAGHIFPNAKIIERNAESLGAQHAAVLRFRSDVVSTVTSITFRRVRVHKGIWSHNQFVAPSIRLANQYALKGTGVLTARSIWDTSSVDRWVAPPDFYARMVAACTGRIFWGTEAEDVTALDGSPAVAISTAPLHFNVKAYLGMICGDGFIRAPIEVQRWRLPGADVHQTVYFPDPGTSTYRVSITGDMVMAESVANSGCAPLSFEQIAIVFGLSAECFDSAICLESARQSHGKIAPIDNRVRKEMIHRLTTEAGVYSVGRFATWRNILLDDVVDDLRIVKSMIEQNDAYNRRLRSV